MELGWTSMGGGPRISRAMSEEKVKVRDAEEVQRRRKQGLRREAGTRPTVGKGRGIGQPPEG